MSEVSRRLRYEILQRDGFRCRYCGATAAEAKLTVDHVQPLTLGGQSIPENLAAACRDCNAGKSSTSPTQHIAADVARDALRMRDILKALAYEASIDRAEVRQKVDAIDAAWERWKYTELNEEIPRPLDWSDSVARFLELGLSLEDVSDAIDRSMRRTHRGGENPEWRYMCGILWNTLKHRQDIARKNLDIERTMADTDSTVDGHLP